MSEQRTSGRSLLYKYLGFGFQLILLLGIAVYAGIRIDKKLAFTTPMFVWVLPLIILAATIIKVIKDTSRK